MPRREGTDLFLKSAAPFTRLQVQARHAAIARPARRRAGMRTSGLRHPAAREAEGQPHLRPAGAPVPQHLRQGAAPQGHHRREPAAVARVAAGQRRLPDGFWLTRAEARQLVAPQRRSLVNGKRSTFRRPGQGRATRSNRREGEGAAADQGRAELAEKRRIPGWVEVDAKKLDGVFKALPDRSELAPGHQREPDRRAVLEVTHGRAVIRRRPYRRFASRIPHAEQCLAEAAHHRCASISRSTPRS